MPSLLSQRDPIIEKIQSYLDPRSAARLEATHPKLQKSVSKSNRYWKDSFVREVAKGHHNHLSCDRFSPNLSPLNIGLSVSVIGRSAFAKVSTEAPKEVKVTISYEPKRPRLKQARWLFELKRAGRLLAMVLGWVRVLKQAAWLLAWFLRCVKHVHIRRTTNQTPCPLH